MAKLKNIKITTLFVSFSLFFGLIAAIIMPVASVPDETYHFNISFNAVSYTHLTLPTKA